MGSDRARVSYDPSRHWRAVIAQQGRVTLEADVNEATAIAAEETREQVLDVIGPAGTPDDGYRVAPVVDGNGNATGDLTIKAGTLYVGGERMVLDADVDYASQPDWIDSAGDPLWAAPTVPQGAVDESVYLLLREQEVEAVEDPALLDVALGGPDTAGRLRIVQRVVRSRIADGTCAAGRSALEAYWQQRGLTFDPTTMRLDSSATLRVFFEQPTEAATPCDPVAQGGYLGAENQLIRVQVASVDEAGAPTLVWGFDNAYFLYRVTVGAVDAAAGTTTLTLASAPIDQYHQPAKDQVVEVLEAAAQLTASDYVAAATGIVTTVATAYQPDTHQLVVATALGAPTTDSPVLFLRVWQDSAPTFQGGTIPSYPGGKVALGTTGIEVTLSSASGLYAPGDYWLFAVRPGTPTTVSPVYPERILDAPQPPDGPRLWACPLAVVEWSAGVPSVVDCRPHFDNLVTLTGELGGCCVDLTPDGVDGGAGLQAVIDRYAGQQGVTICLRPGTYTLPEPLVIAGAHDGLTIEACGPGVVLQATEGSPRSFLLGLILLDEPRGFTLRGIDLKLPSVPLSPTAAAVKAAIAALPRARRGLLLEYVRELHLAIGVYALGGEEVTIAECAFEFAPEQAPLFGAGVFAAQTVVGLELVNNTFRGPQRATVGFAALAAGKEVVGPLQARFGYLQLPTRAQKVGLATLGRMVERRAAAEVGRTPVRGGGGAAAAAAGRLLTVPALADATIERNVFQDLTVPVFVLGRLGTVRVEENTVRACYAGFWLAHTVGAAPLTMVDRAAAAGDAAWGYIAAGGLAALADPVFLLSTVLARILPVTPDKSAAAGSLGALAPPTKALLAEAEKLFRTLYAASARSTPPAAPAQAQAPAGAQGPAPAQEQVALAFPKELSGLFSSGAGRTGQAAVDTGTSLEPRLEVSGNQVDAVVVDADTGVGLLVMTFDAAHPSSLVCSHNRIRSHAAVAPTAALWELLECTVTGNIVSNEAGGDNARSLVLAPRIPRKVAAVAVTGNVLIGPAVLPPRPNAAPFDTWDGLNTRL